MTSIPSRLAAATGPDPQLELEILIELGLVRRSQTPTGKWWLHCESPTFGWHGYCGNLDDWRNGDPPPAARYRVMSSLDAAVGLVERALPGSQWEVWSGGQAYVVAADGWMYRQNGATACLAILCALFAALDAKAALAKPGPGAAG